jgi:hypothetical protein
MHIKDFITVGPATYAIKLSVEININIRVYPKHFGRSYANIFIIYDEKNV